MSYGHSPSEAARTHISCLGTAAHPHATHIGSPHAGAGVQRYLLRVRASISWAYACYASRCAQLSIATVPYSTTLREMGAQYWSNGYPADSNGTCCASRYTYKRCTFQRFPATRHDMCSGPTVLLRVVWYACPTVLLRVLARILDMLRGSCMLRMPMYEYMAGGIPLPVVIPYRL